MSTTERLSDLLTIKFSKEVALTFTEYCAEDEYDSATIEDDIQAGQVELSECLIYVYIQDQHSDLFHDQKTQAHLYSVLSQDFVEQNVQPTIVNTIISNPNVNNNTGISDETKNDSSFLLMFAF